MNNERKVAGGAAGVIIFCALVFMALLALWDWTLFARVIVCAVVIAVTVVAKQSLKE